MIEYYLLDKYRDIGPSLLPPTPELRAKAALVARILDLYITPIQVRVVGCTGGRQQRCHACVSVSLGEVRWLATLAQSREPPGLAQSGKGAG